MQFNNINEMFFSTILIEKPKGSVYYRYAKELNPNSNTPVFFGGKETAIRYAQQSDDQEPKVYEVTFNRDLKLLNVTSWIFSFHFMDMLNKHIDSPEIKKHLCFPLGLPNLSTQINMQNKIDERYFFNVFNNMIRPETRYLPESENHKIFNEQMLNVSFFPGNRKSYKNIDYELVNVLNQIYGSLFDGYIIEKNIPTIWGNTDDNCFTFHPEICIFDISKVPCDVNILNEKLKGGMKSRGGNLRSCNFKPMRDEGPINDKLAEDFKQLWFNDLMSKGFTYDEIMERYWDNEKGTIIIFPKKETISTGGKSKTNKNCIKGSKR